MEQLFRDRLREAHGFMGRAGLWARILADWVRSVPARHLEKLTPHTRFGSFADPARRCIFYARYEASSFSRREITTEHLLLGILRQEPSIVPGGSLEGVRRAIEADEPARRRVATTEDLRISHPAVQAMNVAMEIAREAGRPVTPRDLAAGILRQEDTLAARLLHQALA
jgi:ATP-dependent Clp protease ATP-binding subunit ClpC